MDKFRVGDTVEYVNEVGRSYRNFPIKIRKVTSACYFYEDGCGVYKKSAETRGDDLELRLVYRPETFTNAVLAPPAPETKWKILDTFEQKKEDKMYSFNVSAQEAIAFDEIYKELSRDNPLVRVEFKDTGKVKRIKELKKQLQREITEEQREDIDAEIKSIQDVYTYYVLVHDSLWQKAYIVGIAAPDEDGSVYYSLDNPKDYTKWVEWAKKVKAAKYGGDKGVVTVSRLDV